MATMYTGPNGGWSNTPQPGWTPITSSNAPAGFTNYYQPDASGYTYAPTVQTQQYLDQGYIANGGNNFYMPSTGTYLDGSNGQTSSVNPYSSQLQNQSVIPAGGGIAGGMKGGTDPNTLTSAENHAFINPKGGFTNTLTPEMIAEGWIPNPQYGRQSYDSRYVAPTQGPLLAAANAEMASAANPNDVNLYNAYAAADQAAGPSLNGGRDMTIGGQPYQENYGTIYQDAYGLNPNQSNLTGVNSNMFALSQMYPDSQSAQYVQNTPDLQNVATAMRSGDMKAVQAAGAAASMPTGMILDTSGWGNQQGPNGFDKDGTPVSVSALMNYDSADQVAKNALSNWAKLLNVSGTPTQAYMTDQMGQYWGLSGAARGVDVQQGLAGIGTTFDNPMAIGMGAPGLGINDGPRGSADGQHWMGFNDMNYMTFAHEMQEQLQGSGDPDSSDSGAGGVTIKGGGGGDPMGADFAKANQTYWSSNQGGADPTNSSYQDAKMGTYSGGNLVGSANNDISKYKGQNGANEFPATTIEAKNPLTPGTPINAGLTPQLPGYNEVPNKSNSIGAYGNGVTATGKGNPSTWADGTPITGLPGGGAPGPLPVYVSKDGHTYTNNKQIADANGMILDPNVHNAPFPDGSNVGNPNLPHYTNGKVTPGWTNVDPQTQAWINANANWQDPRSPEDFAKWYTDMTKPPEPTPGPGGPGGPAPGPYVPDGGGGGGGGGGGTGGGNTGPGGGIGKIIPFDSSDKAYNDKYGGSGGSSARKDSGTRDPGTRDRDDDRDDDRKPDSDRGDVDSHPFRNHPLYRGKRKKMADGGMADFSNDPRRGIDPRMLQALMAQQFGNGGGGQGPQFQAPPQMQQMFGMPQQMQQQGGILGPGMIPQNGGIAGTMQMGGPAGLNDQVPPDIAAFGKKKNWAPIGGPSNYATGGMINPQPIIPFPTHGVHGSTGPAQSTGGTTSPGQSPDAGPSYPTGEWWNATPPVYYSDYQGNNYSNPTQDQIDQLGLTKLSAAQRGDLPDPNMPDYMGSSPWPNVGGPLHVPDDPWGPNGNVFNPQGPNPPMTASPTYGLGAPGQFNFQPPAAGGGGTGGGGGDDHGGHHGGHGGGGSGSGGFTSTDGSQYYSWSDPGQWLDYMGMTADQANTQFGNDWAQNGGWSGGWPGDTGTGGDGTGGTGGGAGGPTYADYGAWDKAEDSFNHGQGNMVASTPWLDAVGAMGTNNFGGTMVPENGIWGAHGDANEDLAEAWLQSNWGSGNWGGTGGGGGPGAPQPGFQNVGTNQGGQSWASPGSVPLSGPGTTGLPPTSGQGTTHAVGGQIGGKPKHPDRDTEKNDTVKALLTPGEIVIPLSIAQDQNAPEKAARFVAAIRAKNSPAMALRRAHG